MKKVISLGMASEMRRIFETLKDISTAWPDVLPKSRAEQSEDLLQAFKTVDTLKIEALLLIGTKLPSDVDRVKSVEQNLLRSIHELSQQYRKHRTEPKMTTGISFFTNEVRQTPPAGPIRKIDHIRFQLYRHIDAYRLLVLPIQSVNPEPTIPPGYIVFGSKSASSLTGSPFTLLETGSTGFIIDGMSVNECNDSSGLAELIIGAPQTIPPGYITFGQWPDKSLLTPPLPLTWDGQSVDELPPFASPTRVDDIRKPMSEWRDSDGHKLNHLLSIFNDEFTQGLPISRYVARRQFEGLTALYAAVAYMSVATSAPNNGTIQTEALSVISQAIQTQNSLIGLTLSYHLLFDWMRQNSRPSDMAQLIQLYIDKLGQIHRAFSLNILDAAPFCNWPKRFQHAEALASAIGFELSIYHLNKAIFPTQETPRNHDQLDDFDSQSPFTLVLRPNHSDKNDTDSAIANWLRTTLNDFIPVSAMDNNESRVLESLTENYGEHHVVFPLLGQLTPINSTYFLELGDSKTPASARLKQFDTLPELVFRIVSLLRKNRADNHTTDLNPTQVQQLLTFVAGGINGHFLKAARLVMAIDPTCESILCFVVLDHLARATWLHGGAITDPIVQRTGLVKTATLIALTGIIPPNESIKLVTRTQTYAVQRAFAQLSQPQDSLNPNLPVWALTAFQQLAEHLGSNPDDLQLGKRYINQDAYAAIGPMVPAKKRVRVNNEPLPDHDSIFLAAKVSFSLLRLIQFWMFVTSLSGRA